MEHFAEENWADFVRGINRAEISDDIAAHLASGCASCKAVFDMWKEVRTVTENEARAMPPEDLVRMVKMEFAIQNLKEPQNSCDGMLVFDTEIQPFTAGIRAGAVTARQLVYEADGLTVDLRLDTQCQSAKVCVVGQILDKRAPRSSLCDASVTVWNDKGLPILTTKTSEFGEFHLEFEVQQHLRLSIQIAGQRPVRIPLGSLATDRVTKGTGSGY
jgi:hypothetical protein